ncbi:MAG: hypothetical protein U0Q15_07670 [Kineosporiaceae bacterium]
MVLPVALVAAAVERLIRAHALSFRFVLSAFAVTMGTIMVSLPWLLVTRGHTSTVFYVLQLNGFFAVPICFCLLAMAVLLRAASAMTGAARRR